MERHVLFVLLDASRSNRCLFQNAIPNFTWRDKGNLRSTLVLTT